MSAAISTWLKDILPHTPGVVRSLAKRELILAAREFYQTTLAWQEVVETVYLADGDYTYVVSPSDNTSEAVQILGIEVNGQMISARAERPVGDRGDGTPTSWYPTGSGTFELWPTPDQYDDTVRVRIALIPTEDTTTFPDQARLKHYNAILSGTLGRLLAHPAKPYTNATLAEYHLRRFQTAIGEFRAERKGGGFAGQNWNFPPFGK